MRVELAKKFPCVSNPETGRRNANKLSGWERERDTLKVNLSGKRSPSLPEVLQRGEYRARARARGGTYEWHGNRQAYLRYHAALFHQATGHQAAFFRLALFVNQLKRIRRNLERIKTPRGSIPRVSPVVFVVVLLARSCRVENTRTQELGTRWNVFRVIEQRTIEIARLAR